MTLPHESVQMVTVHVPRSGTVVLCDVQVSCPEEVQLEMVGMPGILIGEVGLGVAGRVKANVAATVGVNVIVSVGVMVLGNVMVLVDVGVMAIVGVEVRVEVGDNVLVGLENVIVICPQAERTRLSPNIRITEICFPVFILPPASILHALNLLKVTGRLLVCLPAKNTRFPYWRLTHSSGMNGWPY